MTTPSAAEAEVLVQSSLSDNNNNDMDASKTLTNFSDLIPQKQVVNNIEKKIEQIKQRTHCSIRNELVLQEVQSNANGVYIKHLITIFNSNNNYQETKKKLNTALYDLQSQGLIKRSEANPPLWKSTSSSDDDTSNLSSINAPFTTNNLQIPTNITGVSAIGKGVIFETVQKSENGVYLKDLINAYISYFNSRLETKKKINTMLYDLQSQGLIKRSEANPPLWKSTSSSDVDISNLSSINQQGTVTNLQIPTNITGGIGKEVIFETVQKSENGVYLKDLINAYISHFNSRLETKKKINTMLYDLQSQGLIKRSEANPPLWKSTSSSDVDISNLSSINQQGTVTNLKIPTSITGGIGKEVIFETVQKSENGVYLKDLINAYISHFNSRLETKKKINTMLYDLQSSGLIYRSDANPPVWKPKSASGAPHRAGPVTAPTATYQSRDHDVTIRCESSLIWVRRELECKLRCELAKWIAPDRHPLSRFDHIWSHFSRKVVGSLNENQIVDILVCWEQQGIAEKKNDGWSLTYLGYFLYNCALPAFNNDTLVLVLFLLGNEVDRDHHPQSLARDIAKYQLPQVDEKQLENTLDFLLSQKWLSRRSAEDKEEEEVSYRLTSLGQVVFDRLTHQGDVSRVLDNLHQRNTLQPQTGFFADFVSDPTVELVQNELAKCGQQRVEELVAKLQHKSTPSQINQVLYTLRQFDLAQVETTDTGAVWSAVTSGNADGSSDAAMATDEVEAAENNNNNDEDVTTAKVEQAV